MHKNRNFRHPTGVSISQKLRTQNAIFLYNILKYVSQRTFQYNNKKKLHEEFMQTTKDCAESKPDTQNIYL